MRIKNINFYLTFEVSGIQRLISVRPEKIFAASVRGLRPKETFIRESYIILKIINSLNKNLERKTKNRLWVTITKTEKFSVYPLSNSWKKGELSVWASHVHRVLDGGNFNIKSIKHVRSNQLF